MLQLSVVLSTVGCDFTPKLSTVSFCGLFRMNAMIDLKKTDRDMTRKGFSDRLNALLDYYGVPPKHNGRQEALKTLMSVSQEASRKWLEGEAIPTADKIARICSLFACRQAWLQTGEMPMISDPEKSEILDLLDQVDPQMKSGILALLRGAANSKQ
jgi:hypothetical protein